MTQARLPDGRVLNFPDDTPMEVIQQTVRGMLGVSESSPASAPAVPGAPDISGPSAGAPDFVQADQPIEAPAEDLTTAGAEANQLLGVDPNIVERGSILPLGRTAEGELEVAVPEGVLEVARAILLPSQALRGVPFTEEDVTRSALAIGVGGAGRALRPPPRVSRIKAQKIINAADSTRLKAEAGRGFEGFRQSGTSLSPENYVSFLAKSEVDLADEGFSKRLHPTLSAVFKDLTDEISDQPKSAQDLLRIRRTIGIAQRSTAPELADERRLADQFQENFDDFVEALPGSEQWQKARRIYQQGKKAELIEEALDRASLVQTGLENGIRIEFRKLLNNQKKIRGFSKAEKDALRKVVEGDFTANTLKKIGKFSFGSGQQSGFVGGVTGGVIGASLLGPVGAAVAPLTGLAAQRGAQARTQRAADVLRALIAGVPLETVTARAAGAGRTSGGIAGAAAAGQLAARQRKAEQDAQQRAVQEELTRITDPRL